MNILFKASSSVVKSVMEIRWPLIQSFLNVMFAKLTKIDMNTVEEPLKNYNTISALFNRNFDLTKYPHFKYTNLKYVLKAPEENAIYSPAQSVLSFANVSKKLTVKGLQYKLTDLLSIKELSDSKKYLEMVFYLSPGDYHNFHSPFAFETAAMKHIHGTKWPVNSTFMKRVNGLLAQNERVVLFGIWYKRRAWIVPVAALNVGCMEFLGFQLVPENLNETIRLIQSYQPGELMGRFKFGSTVVVVLELGENETFELVKSGKVQVGEECVRIVQSE